MHKPYLALVCSNPVSASVSRPEPEYTYEMWVEDLQGIVWNRFIKGKQSLEDMAAAADLNPKTVDNFMWRVTKKPAARTVFQMAVAVGFRNPWIPADAPLQPDEQDFKLLREALPPK